LFVDYLTSYKINVILDNRIESMLQTSTNLILARALRMIEYSYAIES